MAINTYLTFEELQEGLANIYQAPKEEGILEMIVRRPQVDAREILEEGELDPQCGLVGDNWSTRGEPLGADGAPDAEYQLTIMNARVASLVAQVKDRWPLAGDQLFIDMDLSADNLPPGTQLGIGSAVIEITAKPHTGCKKFMARFGQDALEFISSPVGKQLKMRGIYAKVVQPGVIRVGDVAKKLKPG
jgi:hypothetical protein